MLTQPLLDKLSKLHLSGFRAALEEQHYTIPNMPNCPSKSALAC